MYIKNSSWRRVHKEEKAHDTVSQNGSRRRISAENAGRYELDPGPPFPDGELALVQLGKLRGCDVHSSVILSAVDEKVFKRLGVNLTCQPQFKG